MCPWVIYLMRGATYEATVTITGVADIATAQEWRLRCVNESQAEFLTASSTGASPRFVAVPGQAGAMKLTIPASVTALIGVQTGYYDLELTWTGGIVRRYISRGTVQVLEKAGT
jgi:hypothetical protein